ncbi:hypothetical protein TeGR_g7836 [Tetraparma gracilis]|uniref:RAP domain-containing protein n=1 Tax=Tetraparma gracilis TaxID=2962635 RepID=A0ABQ6MXD5_9STRA|nr:hypothetical protein TeGR_g7836 [Tetraparma gracilis]
MPQQRFRSLLSLITSPSTPYSSLVSLTSDRSLASVHTNALLTSLLRRATHRQRPQPPPVRRFVAELAAGLEGSLGDRQVQPKHLREIFENLLALPRLSPQSYGPGYPGAVFPGPRGIHGALLRRAGLVLGGLPPRNLALLLGTLARTPPSVELRSFLGVADERRGLDSLLASLAGSRPLRASPFPARLLHLEALAGLSLPGAFGELLEGTPPSAAPEPGDLVGLARAVAGAPFPAAPPPTFLPELLGRLPAALGELARPGCDMSRPADLVRSLAKLLPSPPPETAAALRAAVENSHLVPLSAPPSLHSLLGDLPSLGVPPEALATAVKNTFPYRDFPADPLASQIYGLPVFRAPKYRRFLGSVLEHFAPEGAPDPLHAPGAAAILANLRLAPPPAFAALLRDPGYCAEVAHAAAPAGLAVLARKLCELGLAPHRSLFATLPFEAYDAPDLAAVARALSLLSDLQPLYRDDVELARGLFEELGRRKPEEYGGGGLGDVYRAEAVAAAGGYLEEVPPLPPSLRARMLVAASRPPAGVPARFRPLRSLLAEMGFSAAEGVPVLPPGSDVLGLYDAAVACPERKIAVVFVGEERCVEGEDEVRSDAETNKTVDMYRKLGWSVVVLPACDDSAILSLAASEAGGGKRARARAKELRYEMLKRKLVVEGGVKFIWLTDWLRPLVPVDVGEE